MCKAIMHRAQGKPQTIEIVTSAFSLVEVCKIQNIKTKKKDDIADFFEHDYILVINLDRLSGEKARDLMMRNLAGLKPPDATHLASALVANVDEMHTFDDGLLALNGRVDKADGTKLKIMKPDAATPMPLFDKATAAPSSDLLVDAADSTPAPETTAFAERALSSAPVLPATDVIASSIATGAALQSPAAMLSLPAIGKAAGSEKTEEIDKNIGSAAGLHPEGT